MERSISSLIFKGSISEAIIEAKSQRKLFIVYISGEDGDSLLLEQSTWMNVDVADSISKYCIFLHILQGSLEASNFSAIYPQKSVPCITAIGYNGVQMCQHEGYISAENLVSSIEKAWLSLHIQETTATVLTAALASKKSEPSSSQAFNSAFCEQGSSSSTELLTSSTDKPIQDAEVKPLVTSELTGKDGGCEPSVEINAEPSEEASSQLVHAHELQSGKDDRPPSLNETSQIATTKIVVPDSSEVKSRSFGVGDGCSAPQGSINLTDHGSEVSLGSSETIANEAEYRLEDTKGDLLDKCTVISKSNDVHLNIRLPDGASLQKKFSVADTLRMVKDYVDENQMSGIDSYDLAIPYPRKVFNEQDLSKALSELELFNRQALIIVPRHPAAGTHGGQSLSFDRRNSSSAVDHSSGTNGGYFGFVKRVLSYMNPFSYLGNNASSSSSEQEANDGLWQYRPNPTVQNNLRARSHTLYSPDNSIPSSGESASKSKKPMSSFGSNIHTLKHDEDDGRFNDRNAFWNGNSTQYGGDSDSK